MALPSRIIVPLVTPFTDDTSTLSEIRVSRLVKFHLDRHASGLLVGSEAGEVSCVSLSERKQLVEWVVRDASGLPVYVNVGANSTASVIDLAQHAERHGARCAVASIPNHTPLTEEEKESFVNTVRRHANLPVAFIGVNNKPVDGLTIWHSASYESLGESDYAVNKHVTADEFVSDDEVVTPLGVFGANNARKLWENWSAVEQLVKALFAYGRPSRVGKAFMEHIGKEMGNTRSPIHGLDTQGWKLLDSISKFLT